MMPRSFVRFWTLCAFFGLFLLAGCVSVPLRADVAVQVGDVLLPDPFADEFLWDNRRLDNVRVGVEGDSYRIRTDVNRYVRGYHLAQYEDVVIDISITQLSSQNDNAYGVVCRGSTDPNSANGYYFLISGDGAYSIRRGRQGDLQPIVHWARSSAINQGGFNRVRVACVGDYLALWVNDNLLAQAHDDTYRRGRVGFAAASGEGQMTDVVFSNLVVSGGAVE